MLGIILLRACRKQRMNILVETSGRDIGMYEYIEHFFPATGWVDENGKQCVYRRLVINFDLDSNIGFAERSVDARMQSEIEAGREAVSE